MRVGVYTICCNESKFVERWAATTKDADYALVADTGSTDNTVELLEAADIDVVPIRVKPWRFDDARNAALALMPSDLDVLISLDMDEVLPSGWRQHLERCWTPGTTRLKYLYVWSWTGSQQPDVTFYSDKIAGRFTHRWKHPVHEILTPTSTEVISICDEVLIEHHPDCEKPRSQYLGLLELAAAEDPQDDRTAHYLGREYWFHRRYQQAIDALQRHLALPRALWKAERAGSMRLIAKCHEAQGQTSEARQWFVRATLEDPTAREAWVDCARFALQTADFFGTLSYCTSALALPVSTGDYLAERYARYEGPYDLMAVAYWNLGHQKEALDSAERAWQLNPSDQRLADNLRKIKQSDDPAI
jgi:hypothetical protein